MAEAAKRAAAPIYHIRVRGNLDDRWADWFAGFVMQTRDSGEALLSGPVTDQAALHGVLGKIRGLDLPLLLLVQTTCPCPQQACPRCGQCMACAIYQSRCGELPYCFRPQTAWDEQWALLTAPLQEGDRK
jgi:hypothetical protein